MTYHNHLLFNNIFLKTLTPSEDELADAQHLVHSSASDWYRAADLSSPSRMAESFISQLLVQQSLDLMPVDSTDGHTWYVVAPWDRATVLGLCYVAPHGADLDGYAQDGRLPKGDHWMIRAVERARALDSKQLRWIILTNGERWRLLDAWSLRRYEAYLEIDLRKLMESPDETLAAYLFWRLFRLEDAFERPEAGAANRLDEFWYRSVVATEATEKYLKASVSDNLATLGGADGIMAQLCMGLVKAVDPTGTHIFTEQERDAIYQDATYLLYRLLFILYAEARGLLPVERADYRAISLERLVDEATDLLRDPQRSAIQPTWLWEQLTTLFSAIQFSDEYLGIPAYNGRLFDNVNKPYLRDYAVGNVFLAEALKELVWIPDSKGALSLERIDFQDLSVRHLGSLYEGMIEYKLFITSEPMLARREKDGKVSYLPSSPTAAKPTDELIPTGKVYFAQSATERKATGTHYTTEDLVEKLVDQTVMRLLSERWQSIAAKLQTWIAEIEATPGTEARLRLQKYVDEQLEDFVRERILSLRICDSAMGSGHFLVHTAHAVTNFIVYVLCQTPWSNSSLDLDPNYWRRHVVEHCLYGIDINSMAVELAKLSLWLATMQFGRPLSFLDHHLKQGNSLLGARLDEILAVLEESDLNRQTPKAMATEAAGQLALREVPQVIQRLEEAKQWLNNIADQIVVRVDDVKGQEIDYERAQAVLAPYKQIGDLLVARRMGLKIKDRDLRAIATAIEQGRQEWLSTLHYQVLEQAKVMIEGCHTFHWDLEFPNIFLHVADEERNTGFNTVVGNPPYLGGFKIKQALGQEFARFLQTAFAHAKGQADLSSFMLRQAFEILRPNGTLGMVLTNTIAQGDTRRVGLARIVQQGGIITYAERYIKWSGDATVEVNLVGIDKARQSELQTCLLDGERQPFISSWLDDLPECEAAALAANQRRAFIGDSIRGIGFVLEENEAKSLLRDPHNADCLLPYLTGEDLNLQFRQTPSRYVICFHNWELNKAEQYPALLDIVRKRVKPVRDQVAEKRENTYWWRFARYRGKLRDAIRGLDSVFVRSEVSENHMISKVPKDWICSHMVIVFAFDDFYHFSILQSAIHETWLRRHSSSLRTDVRYTPTDCFQTFPFPQQPGQISTATADRTGEQYYSWRDQVMASRQLGLTKTYTLLHDPDKRASAIEQLREHHMEMDSAVLVCYGWDDIELEYGFHQNDRKRIRFMPSRRAQREIFARLMELNQQIAAEEAATGIAVDKGGDSEGIDDNE